MFGEKNRSGSSPHHKNSLQSHETSSFWGPNTFLKNTLFSNTRSLPSTPNVRDQDSRQFETTQNLISTFILLDSEQGSEKFLIER